MINTCARWSITHIIIFSCICMFPVDESYDEVETIAVNTQEDDITDIHVPTIGDSFIRMLELII